MTPNHQRGTTTVEMAIAGAAFFLVLFGALEVGRLFYTIHSLSEAARRGARLAAVCPIDDPAIKNVASFGAPDSGVGSLLPSITPAELKLAYLDASGAVTSTYLDIRYVRMTVPSFQFRTIIPGFTRTFTLPDFSTTVPRESLGVPREGAGPECPF